MAFLTTDTELYFHLQGTEGAITVGTATINANNGGVAWIMTAEETAVITRVSLRINTVTTSASAALSVGLQSLTSGAPSGNWLDGSTTSTTNFASEAGTTTGVKTYTLPNSVNVTAGQEFAIVVRNPTAGWTGNLAYNYTHLAKSSAGFPYQAIRTSGAWGTRSGLYPSYVFYGSATKWYGCTGLSTVESSGTIPTGTNEYGLAITIPTGHPDVRYHGFYAKLTTFTAGATFLVKVYSSAGTLLNSTSYSQDFTSPSGYYPCIPSSDIWMVAGSKYYVMIAAGTGTCVTPRIMAGFGTAGLISDVSGAIVCNAATYNGTTFTDVTTTRNIGSLIFNGIRFDQTGGTTNYIIPAGFNTIG